MLFEIDEDYFVKFEKVENSVPLEIDEKIKNMYKKQCFLLEIALLEIYN